MRNFHPLDAPPLILQWSTIPILIRQINNLCKMLKQNAFIFKISDSRYVRSTEFTYSGAQFFLSTGKTRLLRGSFNRSSDGQALLCFNCIEDDILQANPTLLDGMSIEQASAD
jgi:hypothetical protein